jgi:hypothetical protein
MYAEMKPAAEPQQDQLQPAQLAILEPSVDAQTASAFSQN